jgi:hypothetical protein
MIGDGSVADDAASDHDLPVKASRPLSRRRLRKKRNQSKYPRPARLVLWLALPALLWVAIYLAVRALL